MANTGYGGIDLRQSTGGKLLFDALLQSSANALVTTGTTTLRIYEVQSDGTLKTFDFSTSGFVATLPATAFVAMNYQKSVNGTVDTGYWNYVLGTLSGFTIGAIYIQHTYNSGASVPDQLRKFQFAGAEGDLTVDSNHNLNVNAADWNQQPISTTVPLAASAYTTPPTIGAISSAIAAGSVGNVTNPVTVTGTVVLAASQPNYAPATQTTLAALVTTIGTAGAGLTALGAVTLAASQPNYAPVLASSLTSFATAVASDFGNLSTQIGTPAQAGVAAVLGSTAPAGWINAAAFGTNALASQEVASVVAGVNLAATGLDSLIIETGYTAKGALKVMLAATGNKILGNGTSTVTVGDQAMPTVTVGSVTTIIANMSGNDRASTTIQLSTT
jgi:hypothetical protein